MIKPYHHGFVYGVAIIPIRDRYLLDLALWRYSGCLVNFSIDCTKETPIHIAFGLLTCIFCVQVLAIRNLEEV